MWASIFNFLMTRSPAVVALTVLVYTVFTILLWRETRSNGQISRDTLRLTFLMALWDHLAKLSISERGLPPAVNEMFVMLTSPWMEPLLKEVDSWPSAKCKEYLKSGADLQSFGTNPRAVLVLGEVYRRLQNQQAPKPWWRRILRLGKQQQ
jgi:hypothetical protein